MTDTIPAAAREAARDAAVAKLNSIYSGQIPESVAREIADATLDAAWPAVTEPTEQVRDELWRHLDWSFWGTGMADVFREPLADAMVAAITSGQRQQANELIDWWRTRRDSVGRDKYEQQKDEIDRLRAKLTAAGINPDEESK